MNWLEYARREIAKDPVGLAANTAKRNLMAVLTVPHPGNSQNFQAWNQIDQRDQPQMPDTEVGQRAWKSVLDYLGLSKSYQLN